MTSPNPKRVRAASAAVALTAAAFGGGMAASPASAQGTPFDVAAEAYAVDGEFYAGVPDNQAAEIAVHLVSPDGEMLEYDDFRMTLELDHHLEGLAISGVFPEWRCDFDDITIVCEFSELDTETRSKVEFDLYVPGSVEPYDTIDYTITVEHERYGTWSFPGTWTFRPYVESEHEFAVSVPSYEDVAPGAVLSPEVAFRAPDNVAGDAYLYIDDHDRYLDALAEYANCGRNDGGAILCDLSDLDLEPGAVYVIAADTPVTVTLKESAPGPMLFYTQFDVNPIDIWAADELAQVVSGSSGATLRFERTDRSDLEESQVMRVTSAKHPYDLAVPGGNLNAAVGVAVFPIPVSNLGPADAVPTSHPYSGEGAFSVALQLPSGVQVRSDDEYGFVESGDFRCWDTTKSDWRHIDPAEHGMERVDVQCYVEIVAAGASTTLDLPVTVTDAASATDGLVVVKDGAELWGEEFGYPVLDADLSNNSAVLALNAADAVGVPPKLEQTGTSLTVVVSTAAALAVVGAVLFVLFRRRRIATEWS